MSQPKRVAKEVAMQPSLKFQNGGHLDFTLSRKWAFVMAND